MFENVIGNEKNKQILEKTVKLNKVSHSYIFCGIEGIGKKEIAKEFANMILNKDINNNPDFLLIEPEDGKIKIEKIREIQKKAAEKPIISDKKIYILNDADTMTTEAQNCLLKTLEEPPEYLTIILICSNENNLLSTIKSRCTRMYFEPIPEEKIKEYIEKNLGISIKQNTIELSQGSIGKTLKIQENQAFFENIEKILLNISQKDIIEIMQMSEEIYKSKEEIEYILEYINVLALKLSEKNIKYIECISIVEEVKKRLKANSNYDMCIDYLLFNIYDKVSTKVQ